MTKPAFVYTPDGRQIEGYFDESRHLFFPVAVAKELIVAQGGLIVVEDEQTRGGAE